MKAQNTPSRRFNGTRQLYGQPFEAYANAHVMVIGIGGVGSWAAEALARCGIGQISLVDMDVVVESNINRQLAALDSTLGQNKIDVIASRCKDINPQIKINTIDDFLTVDNIDHILSVQPDIILDCIDDVPAKIGLILHCRFNRLALIVCGGAGGKIDPLQIRAADLSKTTQDPMLAKIRRELRSKGIAKKTKEKFNLCCIYSLENPKQHKNIQSNAGLRCGGYGSSVVVTSSFAMAAVAETLKRISIQSNL